MKLSFENLVESKLAVIPLYPIEPWNDKKEIPEDKRGARAARDAFKEVKLELRANPAAADSLKYGSYFKVFDQGTPEQWCRWRDDLKRAWAGLGNTTGPLRAATVRHLLEGQALDDFENYMRPDEVTETVDNINKALKMVAVNIFPADAVTHMKHYLNFELKKPKALTARALKTRLERLNSWFEYFPADGNGRVGRVTLLTEQELRGIYYRMLPASWRRKMDENNTFSPYETPFKDMVDYAERLELTEDRYEKSTGGRFGSSAIRQGRAGKAKGGSPSNGVPESGNVKGGVASKFSKNRDCLIHGVDCGHHSHQCKVLKAHATKVKAQFEAQPRKFVHKKNQNYKRPNSDSTIGSTSDRKYSKSEVQQMMKNFSSKLNVESHNMEVEAVATNEEMEVDQALEELFNN
jgi:hypothetical protein